MNSAIKEGLRRLLPSGVGRHRIMGGPLRGRWLVTSWHDYPAAILGRTEEHLLQWFEGNAAEGETWLDVGAHYGYTALALSRFVGRAGRVFAFEPMLSTAGCVARTRDLNGLDNLVVVPVALGSGEGLTVNMMPTYRGMVDATAGRVASNEVFLQCSLDWLWPRLAGDGGQRVHGVKVDVQGMELEVLRGMRAILKASMPKLVVELHEGVSRSEFLDVLEECGYPRLGTAVEPGAGGAANDYAENLSYAFRAQG